MSELDSVTGDPARWPHLEACYDLARRAADGFAPPPCREGAFTAARWGLHIGLTLAALDSEWAAAVRAETEDYDIARDGWEAATHARYSMVQDVHDLARVARLLAGATAEQQEPTD